MPLIYEMGNEGDDLPAFPKRYEAQTAFMRILFVQCKKP
ncbi:MAG: hypothetical protein ACI978_002003 [Oleispira sp.]|jgi:hypothetical protein